MEKHVLCKKDHLSVGQKEVFKIDKLSIVLVHTQDGYYAMRDVCPHQGGPLGRGALQGAAEPSEVGQYCYERKGQILYCPWHHWEFDVTNGCSVRDSKLRLKTYEVGVEGDDVVLYK